MYTNPNDPFVLARAKHLVKSVRQQYPKNLRPNMVTRFLYQKVLSRNPTADEQATVSSFLVPQITDPKMEDLAQTLLISNEFFFVD